MLLPLPQDAGITQCEVIIVHLRKQIEKLKRQLEELSHRTPPRTITVTTHETTTTSETDGGGAAKPAKDSGKGGSNSTTMIFGSSQSDSILLTILQKLQELSSDITAGRTDSHVASRCVFVGGRGEGGGGCSIAGNFFFFFFFQNVCLCTPDPLKCV